MKHCATCTCKQPEVETIVRNGVRVTKTTFDNGTVVTADS